MHKRKSNLAHAFETTQKMIHLADYLVRRNLFHHIRPGYAIWYLCARKAPKAVSLDEIAEALVKGNVITSLDEDSLRKSAFRLAEYHTKSGKLRRLPNDYYTIR
jgi:hypothetical protein